MGKKIWGIVSGLIILFAIIVGFSIIGSPQSQRLSKLDSQKVTDLQNIQWQIISYWQKTGALPSAAAALNDSLSGFSYPLDPQTGEMYEYKMTGQYSFQLCANFNRPSSAQQSSAYPILTNPKGSLSMDYWTHETGRVCFDRNIDPTLYPVYKQ